MKKLLSVLFLFIFSLLILGSQINAQIQGPGDWLEFEFYDCYDKASDTWYPVGSCYYPVDDADCSEFSFECDY